MTHPIFRKEIFIETAFERRFQAMLRSAWQKQSWHVIVADPGAGKTIGIRDLIRTSGSPAIIAVTAPKNNEEELALGNQLFTALGLPLRGRWSDRKPKLMGSMVQFGVKCLIVDDAQDLSLEHLMFIKELTDQGRLHYGYPVGLCLVTAGRGNTIPLKEIFDQPDIMWLQFRRRLDKLEPYTWLTQPVLDPTNSGRVTMDYLMKLVTTALEWSHAAGETDVKTEMLESAASLLVLRRDTLRIIDGAGPSIEAPQSEPTEQGNGSGTEPERKAMPANHVPHTTETVGTVGEQVQTGKTPKCTFSGVVSIELQRFLDSGVTLVECPDCARMRTLSPSKGVLRFPSHDKRKTNAPVTSQRWAMCETIWEVVGGESK